VTPNLHDLKARILSEIRVTPSPTRRTSQIQTWSVLQASFAASGALFFALDGLRHGQGRPLWLHAASLLGWTAVAGLSMWGALFHGPSALGRPRVVAIVVAVGTPAVLLAMMLAFAAACPEVTRLHSERLGLKCLGLTMVTAGLPLFGLALVRRGAAPRHASAIGAALGSACGAAAGVMVEMWCPVATPRHIVVGHILPIAMLAALGAVLGARFIAMRTRRRAT
jgi:hypothetical protein